ncbi:MAG: hypothetical protein JWN38_356 [Candidatus Saccharibacteria bacterium]|nr:hypothetical protein [Candidatus Saccharibacteria bacterium]
MRPRKLKTILGIGLALALALSTSACGSSGVNEKNAQQCMTQLTPDQKTQYENAQLAEGNQVQSTTNNPDGTQDVCVIDPTTGQMHNYNSSFADYALYAGMTGRYNSFGSIGLITGNLSFTEAFLLDHMLGITSSGSVFNPYSHTYGNAYQRQPVIVQHVHVTSVTYGNSAPISYKAYKKQTPPLGYAKPPVVPKKTNTVATASAGSSTLTPVKGATPKSYIKQNKSSLTPLKSSSNSTTGNLTNPGKSGTTSGGGSSGTSGSSKSGTSGSSKSGSSGSKSGGSSHSSSHSSSHH